MTRINQLCIPKENLTDPMPTNTSTDPGTTLRQRKKDPLHGSSSSNQNSSKCEDIDEPISSNQQESGESTNQFSDFIEEKDYIIHKRTPDDNLVSLSIKYGVTSEAIMQANGFITTDLDFVEYSELIIPLNENVSIRNVEVNSHEKELNKRRRLIISFSRLKKVKEDVAHFYLYDNQWDLDLALKAYDEDEEWENTHKSSNSKKKSPKQGASHPHVIYSSMGSIQE